MKEHPPVTSCGFIFICVVATIGLTLFSVATKMYKYRERDDRPFDQRFAKQLKHKFSRMILIEMSAIYKNLMADSKFAKVAGDSLFQELSRVTKLSVSQQMKQLQK